MTAHLPLTVATAGLPPNVTPAEFLVLVGVIAERGHNLGVGLATMATAGATYREWVNGAAARGFTGQRQLRDAMRAGRATPRGLRLAAAVVSHFQPSEIPVLIQRAMLRDSWLTHPTPEAFSALRSSPVLRRGAASNQPHGGQYCPLPVDDSSKGSPNA